MPHDISGVYAQLYSDAYPKEVEAVIGINSSVVEELQEILKVERMSSEDYKRKMNKDARLRYLGQRMLSVSGYVEIQWPAYELLFNNHTHTRTEINVLREIFTKRFYSKNTVNEMKHDYENYNRILHQKCAEDLPVLFILDYDSCDNQIYNDIDWKKLHEDIITNNNIQEVTVLSGNPYFIYYNPHDIAGSAQKFIDNLKGHK